MSFSVSFPMLIHKRIRLRGSAVAAVVQIRVHKRMQRQWADLPGWVQARGGGHWRVDEEINA